jgi:hypothetical protein
MEKICLKAARKTGTGWDTPMALPHEDKESPRVGTTGLKYKFQGSSATVTYSRS